MTDCYEKLNVKWLTVQGYLSIHIDQFVMSMLDMQVLMHFNHSDSETKTFRSN